MTPLGEIIGAYRVVAKLAEGGMGAVYVGEHVALGRRAAVKLLLPELSRNRTQVERFFNEACAATAASHPGIVQIYEFGTTPSGVAFLVMELLAGESLACRLRRGRLTPHTAVRITAQVAGALAAAHAGGVIHRDLKTDNIMLVPDPDVPGGERVKLLDFGIARLTRSGIDALTRTGDIMGTPLYMAPEQAQHAHSVDARTDLYALGCILFEMLCGRPPFMYESIGELIGAHLMEAPPPVLSLAPEVPADLAQLVGRLLAKAPDQRPASANALAADLRLLRITEPPRASAVAPILERSTPCATGGEIVAPRSKLFRPAAILGAIVGATALVLLWRAVRTESPRASHEIGMKTDSPPPPMRDAAPKPDPVAPAVIQLPDAAPAPLPRQPVPSEERPPRSTPMARKLVPPHPAAHRDRSVFPPRPADEPHPDEPVFPPIR